MQEIFPQTDAEADGSSAPGPFPTLRQLGLGAAELDALRDQGYLNQDDRGHGHNGYWRLRFRYDRRTRTVYLGRNQRFVDAVSYELNTLQNDHRLRQRLVEVTKQGRKTLRAAKQRLAGVLQQLGMHYHGDTIRKFRSNRVIAD